MFIMGADKTLARLKDAPGPPLEAVIVDKDMRVHVSPGLEDKIIWHMQLQDGKLAAATVAIDRARPTTACGRRNSPWRLCGYFASGFALTRDGTSLAEERVRPAEAPKDANFVSWRLGASASWRFDFPKTRLMRRRDLPTLLLGLIRCCPPHVRTATVRPRAATNRTIASMILRTTTATPPARARSRDSCVHAQCAEVHARCVAQCHDDTSHSASMRVGGAHSQSRRTALCTRMLQRIGLGLGLVALLVVGACGDDDTTASDAGKKPHSAHDAQVSHPDHGGDASTVPDTFAVGRRQRDELARARLGHGHGARCRHNHDDRRRREDLEDDRRRGGTVTIQGVKVEIPPGALAEDTLITIEKTSDKAPKGLKAYSPVFKFGPDGQQFSMIVSVSIDFTGDDAMTRVYWTSVFDSPDDLGGSGR